MIWFSQKQCSVWQQIQEKQHICNTLSPSCGFRRNCRFLWKFWGGGSSFRNVWRHHGKTNPNLRGVCCRNGRLSLRSCRFWKRIIEVKMTLRVAINLDNNLNIFQDVERFVSKNKKQTAIFVLDFCR